MLGMGRTTDGTPDGPAFRLRSFRALRLADSKVGAAASHRVFARPYRRRRRRDLLLDEEPALYLHEYTSSGLSVRGLVGLLDLAGAPGTVFPHEAVHPEQVEDLARRMEEMAVNPAPILLMHRGPERVRAVLAGTATRTPDLVYTDRGDQLHRIWRIPDPAVVDPLTDLLRGTRAVIADGHHRQAAAERLRRRHPGTPWESTLVMLVDQLDTPLQLCAVHRTVPRLALREVAAVAERRGDRFEEHRSSHEALARLDRALVLHDGHRWASVTPADPAMLVCWLHERLLPALEVSEDRIAYHHSAAAALERTGSGLAVLLPAPTFDDVDGSARSGRLLPPKATSFQPKPHLGVLMRSVPDE